MELVFFHCVWRLHLKTLHSEGNFEGQMTTTHTTSEETGHPTLHAFVQKEGAGTSGRTKLGNLDWAYMYLVWPWLPESLGTQFVPYLICCYI